MSCDHSEQWFDRTVCPEPCGMMHTYCLKCNVKLEACEWLRSGTADELRSLRELTEQEALHRAAAKVIERFWETAAKTGNSFNAYDFIHNLCDNGMVLQWKEGYVPDDLPGPAA